MKRTYIRFHQHNIVVILKKYNITVVEYNVFTTLAFNILIEGLRRTKAWQATDAVHKNTFMLLTECSYKKWCGCFYTEFNSCLFTVGSNVSLKSLHSEYGWKKDERLLYIQRTVQWQDVQMANVSSMSELAWHQHACFSRLYGMTFQVTMRSTAGTNSRVMYCLWVQTRWVGPSTELQDHLKVSDHRRQPKIHFDKKELHLHTVKAKWNSWTLQTFLFHKTFLICSTNEKSNFYQTTNLSTCQICHVHTETFLFNTGSVFGFFGFMTENVYLYDNF